MSIKSDKWIRTMALEHRILVPPGDRRALADAICRVLRNPALRAALGEAGRARAAGCFSASAVLPHLEALYRTMGLAPSLANHTTGK